MINSAMRKLKEKYWVMQERRCIDWEKTVIGNRKRLTVLIELTELSFRKTVVL
jgi:hypothetical protein